MRRTNHHTTSVESLFFSNFAYFHTYVYKEWCDGKENLPSAVGLEGVRHVKEGARRDFASTRFTTSLLVIDIIFAFKF